MTLSMYQYYNWFSQAIDMCHFFDWFNNMPIGYALRILVIYIINVVLSQNMVFRNLIEIWFSFRQRLDKCLIVFIGESLITL